MWWTGIITTLSNIFGAPRLKRKLEDALDLILDLERRLKVAQTRSGPMLREPSSAELALVAAQVHERVIDQVVAELTPMLSEKAAYQLSQLMKHASPRDEAPSVRVWMEEGGPIAHVRFELPAMSRELKVMI